MVKVAYTTEELNADCLKFVQAIGVFSPIHSLFYDVARLIGCRFEELTEISRFNRINESQIEFSPSKGNTTRIIVVNELPRLFIDMVDQQNDIFKHVSYSTTRRYFRAHWPAGRILLDKNTESKYVTFYLFRYSYIKTLAASGKSQAEIATKMGEVDQKNIAYYINAPLVYFQ